MIPGTVNNSMSGSSNIVDSHQNGWEISARCSPLDGKRNMLSLSCYYPKGTSESDVIEAATRAIKEEFQGKTADDQREAVPDDM